MVAANSQPEPVIITFAKIKAAVDAFNAGEANVFEALDRIRLALSRSACPNAGGLLNAEIAGVREATVPAGARAVYLPPYSPDLEPIALAFSTVTWVLGRARQPGPLCRAAGCRPPRIECGPKRKNPREARDFRDIAGVFGGAPLWRQCFVRSPTSTSPCPIRSSRTISAQSGSSHWKSAGLVLLPIRSQTT